MQNTNLEQIQRRLVPLRRKLLEHRVYQTISSLEDMHIFMESHVFAVWDFMSLLKALQRKLTCVEVPWTPNSYVLGRRFVNEIVLDEESDLRGGASLSHFELYLQAMRECGADTQPIANLIRALQNGATVEEALQRDGTPDGTAAFCRETFHIIRNDSAAAIAGAFTFGREDLIPDMFRAFVGRLADRFPNHLNTFSYYLQRHIEIDGDDHGPMALRMMEEICGEDAEAWREAEASAERAVAARIALWDSIVAAIERKRIAVA